jgi:hypothetical protein
LRGSPCRRSHSPQYATDRELGDIPHSRTLVKIDGSIRVRTVAPQLGQHNAEIFGQKGEGFNIVVHTP